MFQQGLKLLSGVVLCMIVCACMSKFDTNGSAYVVRPYIKDGYYTDGTFYYDIDKTDAIVIGTAKNERTLVIPDAVGINEVTYPLTKVQNLGVFNKETYETSQKVTNNDNLTSLTIGGNVKSFGKDVFFSEVIYPSGYKKDEDDKMRRFPNLETIIVIPGNETFDSRNNCNAIIHTEKGELLLGCKNSVVPSGVKKISAAAFRGCQGLKQLTFPTSLNIVAPYAFSDSHLQSVDLPVDVYHIGREAFYGCDSLVSVSLYCNGVSIDSRAFQHCSSLKDSVSEVRFYTPHISVLSAEDVFDEGCNCLLVPKGQLATFESWKKCFLTIKEMDK